MKLALTLALSTALPASAGGFNPALEEPEVIAPRDTAEWVLPVIIGAVVLCAIACGGGDDAPEAIKPPGPVCFAGGEC